MLVGRGIPPCIVFLKLMLVVVHDEQRKAAAGNAFQFAAGRG
jgi:hypothetical protein